MRARLQECLTRVAAGLCVAAGLALQPAAAVASTAEELEPTSSLLGSYLAGRFASSQHETTAAAGFYRGALQRDPGDEVLLEQAFLMEAMGADWPRAKSMAQQLADKQTTNRMARIFLALTAFKAGAYAEADAHLLAANSGPIGELTAALARGWVKLAEGDAKAAFAIFDTPKQVEWAQEYLRYHRALAADVAGRRLEARSGFQAVFKKDNRTLRTALAYAQHAAHHGDLKLARSILNENIERTPGEGHPLVRALLGQIDAGRKTGLLVSTPTEGLAEVFYGLGEALTGEGGFSIGVLYLQMALYLKPDMPFALVALAHAYESTKSYAEANEVYRRVPRGTALQPSIEIQKAFNLTALDKVDEAKSLLEKVAASDAKDIRPLEALGNIMRSRKRYAEAVEYYTRAIALIPKAEKRHWTYFYSRGTCYERLKNWPPAEADLQKALQLYSDQPLILNYLGYSWIDQKRNLKQGMALIEKAVQLKPDDGYIVDSLGWAHYRLGNYKEAVHFLERAVELRPEDPVLNDHLGDALWQVGRKREARFQWGQALTLNPEPEEVEKIKAKLAKGLVGSPTARPLKRSAVVRSGATKKRVGTEQTPAAPVVE